MTDIPLAPLERLLKKHGAQRVSVTACEELRDILEEMVAEIAQKANKLAEHAHRKTITRDDIKLAK